jgi:hypothetical protein
MGRLRSNYLRLAVAILSLWGFSGCGGGTKAGRPIYPGRITLTPGSNTSVVLGGVLGFAASAQTSSGTNISTSFTFSSSDTSILTLAPNGVACAGHWDVNYTVCTPGGIGPVTVTASALGATSVPTYVFVHPVIDTITVTGVVLNGVQVQEPCLSQSQSMTVEAHAFSQGTDVTSSVGPFIFSANNPSVLIFAPIVNTFYNFATNQATATANYPGITQIYATASGVTSSSFLQPQYQNSQGDTSPPLDFFETCPIQNIALQVGHIGSEQTSFVSAKGASAQTAYATLIDIMGNSSLPNTNGAIVLNNIPLTWTASQPGVLSTTGSCLESCSLSTSLPGSGSVTASCSPPSCNIGFPLIPASLASVLALDPSCTQFSQFFHAQYPQFINCQQLIPVPVYSSPVFIAPTGNTPLAGNGAISALVTGATASASLLATGTGCAHVAPQTCTTSIYSLSTSKASTGPAYPLPFSPNSMLFDLAGDKAYIGSDFGAQAITPSNFGTSNSPYAALGTVTGIVLGISANGSLAVFSDTLHTPNQAYVVNTTNASSPSATALNISSATAAAFSPDGLKAFIIGGNGDTSLYIYSPLQALQGPITLFGPGNSMAFSPNGAFAYVAQSSTSTSSANLTAFATCNNQLAANLPLPGNPILMRVLPGVHIDGTDSLGNPIPDGIHVLVLDATGFDVVTSNISLPASGTLCPQLLSFNPLQRIALGQGTLQPPVNFFASADGSQLYITSTNNAGILVYDFGTGAVTGIELQGNATPLSSDMSVDAGTILVAGSDGMLHEVSTTLGGADLVQLPFPNLPDYLNPFCTFNPAAGPCTLNLVLARP